MSSIAKRILAIITAVAVGSVIGLSAPALVVISGLILLLNRRNKDILYDKIEDLKITNGSNKELIKFLESIQRMLK